MAKINNAAVSATKAANLTKVHQYALAKRPPYITLLFSLIYDLFVKRGNDEYTVGEILAGAEAYANTLGVVLGPKWRQCITNAFYVLHRDSFIKYDARDKSFRLTAHMRTIMDCIPPLVERFSEGCDRERGVCAFFDKVIPRKSRRGPTNRELREDNADLNGQILDMRDGIAAHEAICPLTNQPSNGQPSGLERQSTHLTQELSSGMDDSMYASQSQVLPSQIPQPSAGPSQPSTPPRQRVINNNPYPTPTSAPRPLVTRPLALNSTQFFTPPSSPFITRSSSSVLDPASGTASSRLTDPGQSQVSGGNSGPAPMDVDPPSGLAGPSQEVEDPRNSAFLTGHLMQAGQETVSLATSESTPGAGASMTSSASTLTPTSSIASLLRSTILEREQQIKDNLDRIKQLEKDSKIYKQQVSILTEDQFNRLSEVDTLKEVIDTLKGEIVTLKQEIMKLRMLEEQGVDV